MVSKYRLDTINSTATKEAITRTFEIANNYAGELSIEVLSLDKVELDPENKRDLLLTLQDAKNGIDKNDPDYERKKQDWISLESLAKTIKDDQLINPIFVYRYGNKCRLIAGERRTLASAIAGKKEIIARIASQRPIGTKLRVLQWIENNERSDLSLAERIASLEDIVKEYFIESKIKNDSEKITAKILSDLTGISNTQARRYLLILQCKPEIKQAVYAGKLENIKLIEFICSVKNAELQKELLAAASTGFSFDEVEKLKKSLETGQKKIKVKSGPKKINVNLGRARPNLVKIIVDALISSNSLENKIIKGINIIYNQSQWDSADSAEKAFKKIMTLIEQ